MKVLNLLTSGGVGGIEVLCKDIGEFSDIENRFAFYMERETYFGRWSYPIWMCLIWTQGRSCP